MSLFGVVYLAGYSFAIQSLSSEAEEDLNRISKEKKWFFESNNYLLTIDWIEMCLESTEKDDINATWYCNQAMNLYKKNSTATFPLHRDEFIKRIAYKAMIIDMKSKLRWMELEQLNNSSLALEKLNKMLSGNGQLWMLLLLLLVVLFVVYGLYFNPENSEMKRPVKEVESFSDSKKKIS